MNDDARPQESHPFRVGEELISIGNTEGSYRVRIESEPFPSPLGDSVFVTVLDGAWEGHQIVERIIDLHR